MFYCLFIPDILCGFGFPLCRTRGILLNLLVAEARRSETGGMIVCRELLYLQDEIGDTVAGIPVDLHTKILGAHLCS
jgi:hypothetical protein